jgi:hypothetical protein
MEKSESIVEISKALNEFQFAVKNVSKDGNNPFFKSKYATLENVISTAKHAMYVNGLSFAQFPDADGLYTVIMHTSGEWIGAHANLELKGHTPQDQGSAITYMRRYALSAALGLATEDDDDGNAASKPTPMGSKAVAPVPPKQVADKRSVQKARIKELCDKKVIEPLTDGDDYKRYVKENTGLELEAGNYEQIIERLEALQ